MFQVTENISLKLIGSSDAKDIFRILDANRRYFRRWLPFVDSTLTEADSQAFVDSVLENLSREPVFVIKYDGETVGLIGVNCNHSANRKTEIGYWIAEEYQGKGIVTQSLQVIIPYLFDGMGFNRIQIKVAVGNTRSNEIPKRLGFVFEGVERDGELLVDDQFTDLNVYSLLLKDYRRENRRQ